jgi:hypothetical protein
MNSAAERGGIACDQVQARQMVRVFQAGNDRLRRAHPPRDLFLRQPDLMPGFDHGSNQGINGTEPIVFLPHLGIFQKTFSKLRKMSHYLISSTAREEQRSKFK